MISVMMRRVLGDTLDVAQPVYICFADQEKAYNCVCRGTLWRTIQEYREGGILLGNMVVQLLVLLPHSKKVWASNISSGLAVWSLHVPHPHVWV